MRRPLSTDQFWSVYRDCALVCFCVLKKAFWLIGPNCSTFKCCLHPKVKCVLYYKHVCWISKCQAIFINIHSPFTCWICMFSHIPLEPWVPLTVGNIFINFLMDMRAIYFVVNTCLFPDSNENMMVTEMQGKFWLTTSYNI